MISKHTLEIISLNNLTESVSIKRCIVLDTGYIWNECIFKACVFHIVLYWDRAVHPSRWKTKKKKNTTTQLSELQYKYRFMHTMKASFPIFWLVSQHCYNALLCIWAIIYFFPHMNVKGRKNKRCLVCSELKTAAWSGHLCHLKLDLFFFFNWSEL